MVNLTMPVNLPLGQLKRMPLGLRLAVLFALLIVLGMGAMSLVILIKQSELRHQQIEDFGTALAMQLAASAVEPLFTDDRVALQLLASNFAKLPSIAGAEIVGRGGDVVARFGLRVAASTATVDAGGRWLDRLQAPAETLSFTSPITFKGRRAGDARLSVDTRQHSRVYRRTLRTLLISCALVTLIALVAAWYISRCVSRPIRRLLEATARIGSGELPVLVAERRTDELGQLMAAINEMGHGLLQKRQVEALLGRFLAKDVAEEVLAQLDTVSIGGERVEATVLFADIVGFTGMSERLSPEEVGEFLNEYYEYFANCSRYYSGTVDKFIGDCAMVVFGAPKPDPEHRVHAVCCAMLMQKLVARLNERRCAMGKPSVLVRIGLNSGEMLAGVMGGRDRMEYTVVGDSVNMASRLCGEAAGGQIIIEQALYQVLARANAIQAVPSRTICLRGKTLPSTIYAVEDVALEYRLAIDGLVEEMIGHRSAA